MSQESLSLLILAGDVRRIRKTGGEVLREFRISRGWTQRCFADLLGISYVHMCNVELGHADPGNVLLMAEKLCKEKARICER